MIGCYIRTIKSENSNFKKLEKPYSTILESILIFQQLEYLQSMTMHLYSLVLLVFTVLRVLHGCSSSDPARIESRIRVPHRNVPVELGDDTTTPAPVTVTPKKVKPAVGKTRKPHTAITTPSPMKPGDQEDVLTMEDRINDINSSPEWWMVSGKPYIKPEAGIFMTPQTSVFIPAATWTHLIEMKMPCLSQVLPPSDQTSWVTLVNTLSRMISSLGDKAIKGASRLNAEHLNYIVETQRNLEQFLSGIRSHIRRIDTYEQYVYGLMEYKCPRIDDSMIRDDVGKPSSMDKLITSLDSLHLESDLGGDTIAHEAPLDLKSIAHEVSSHDIFKQTILKSVKEVLAEVKKSNAAVVTTTTTAAPLTTSSTASTLVTTTSETPQNTTFKTGHVRPALGGAPIIDINKMSVEVTGRRKRETKTPDTYANNVVHQYINHGSFTNVLGTDGTGDEANRRASSNRPSNDDSSEKSFVSQTFDYSAAGVKTEAIPVITNHHPEAGHTKSSSKSVVMTIRESDLYKPLNPKEEFVLNLKQMLERLDDMPDRENATRNVDDINSYYLPLLEDIGTISADEPLPVDAGQRGVLTVKLCYSWLNNNFNVVTYCADRYVNNVKRWSRRCSGTSPGDLNYLNDQPYSRFAKPGKTAEFLAEVKRYRSKFMSGHTLSKFNTGPSRYGRRKRGLGDDIMNTFWKPMFGAVGEDEMDDIQSFLKETTDSQKTLFQNQEKLMSYQRSQTDRMDTITQVITNLTQVIKIELSSTRSDLSKLSEVVNQLSEASKIQETYAAIFTMQTYVHNALTLLKFRLNDISANYKTIANMVKRKYLSPSILSMDTLEGLLGDMSSFDHSEWDIAPTWRSLATLDDKSASILVYERRLLITLKVPLIRKTHDYVVYLAQSLPFRIGPQIVGTRGSGHYYIVDNMNKLWYKLTPLEYTTCLNNPGHICPESVPSNTFNYKDCYASIITGSSLSEPNNLCSLHTLDGSLEDMDNGQGFIGKTLSHNQWIVSVLNPSGILSYELCDGDDVHKAAQTKSKLLSDISVITVSDGCRVQVGQTLFSAVKNWRTNSHHTVLFDDTLLISNAGFSNLKIWQMSSLIPDNLRNATIFTFSQDPSVAKKDYLFKNGQATLSELTDMLLSKNHTIEELGLVEPQYPKVPVFQAHRPSTWSLSHWQIWSFIFGSLPIILLIVFVVYVVLKFMFVSKKSAATVAFSALPTSFANIIDDVQDKSQMTSLVTKLEGLQSALNQSLLSTHHGDNVAGSTSLHHHASSHAYSIVMLVLMLFMICMMFVHCYHLLIQRDLVRKIMRSSCNYPKNRSVTMHNIEDPVIMIFLIQVYVWGKRNPTNTTMALQVATLPSPYQQWSVRHGSSSNAMASTSQITRSSKYLSIELNWSSMCILSNDMPQLDTCEDMPPRCIIPVKDLDMAVDGGLPWNWRRIHQEHVLKIEVGRLGAMKLLYHYDQESHGSYQDVPLVRISTTDR